MTCTCESTSKELWEDQGHDEDSRGFTSQRQWVYSSKTSWSNPLRSWTKCFPNRQPAIIPLIFFDTCSPMFCPPQVGFDTYSVEESFFLHSNLSAGGNSRINYPAWGSPVKTMRIACEFVYKYWLIVIIRVSTLWSRNVRKSSLIFYEIMDHGPNWAWCSKANLWVHQRENGTKRWARQLVSGPRTKYAIVQAAHGTSP